MHAQSHFNPLSVTLVSSAVTNLLILASDTDGFKVTWDLPNNPNGVIQNYIVTIRDTVIGEIVINTTNRYQNKTFTGLSKLIIG